MRTSSSQPRLLWHVPPWLRGPPLGRGMSSGRFPLNRAHTELYWASGAGTEMAKSEVDSDTMNSLSPRLLHKQSFLRSIAATGACQQVVVLVWCTPE